MSYLTQLLEDLGWSTGDRVPLASSENAALEELLLSRQAELKTLRERASRIRENQGDLEKYKKHVSGEAQENTKLLVTLKQHYDHEVANRILQNNDKSRMHIDLGKSQKELETVKSRIHLVQGDTSRLLQKVEKLGKDVQLERDVLEEWRIALNSSTDDIDALQKYTKEDGSLAKQLETKRQQLKTELDKAQASLIKLCGSVLAEETSRERLSMKMAEALKHRQELVGSWSNAVENLRQRDEDIRQTKEECENLREEISKAAERIREIEEYLERQRSDNLAAERANIDLAVEVGMLRKRTAELTEQNFLAAANIKNLQKLLSTFSKTMAEIRSQNKYVEQEIKRKAAMNETTARTIDELSSKIAKYKEEQQSASERVNQLENIFKEEERYLENICVNQERAMHCSYLDQQKLLKVQEDINSIKKVISTVNITLSSLGERHNNLMKELEGTRSNLYQTEYAGMMTESDIDRIKKEREANENDTEADDRINLLQNSLGAYKKRTGALSTQISRLQRDMIVIGNNLLKEQAILEKLDNNVLNGQLWVEGEKTALKTLANDTRAKKVEEALLRLRVAHASRAMNSATNRTYELQACKIDAETLMSERFVEINAVKDMLSIQKRAVMEDANNFNCQLRERRYRIEQLKKRHEILMASFGKREDGKELSVTFFKIKYAQERAELQEQGDMLDAVMRKGEKEVRSLETALKLVSDANMHFANKLSLVKDDDPDILMIKVLNDEVDKLQMVVATLTSEINQSKIAAEEVEQFITGNDVKIKRLDTEKKEAKYAAQVAESSLVKTNERLRNARKVANKLKKQGKEFFADPNLVELFKMEIKMKDFDEAIYNAVRQLNAIMPDVARDACGKFSA